MSWAAAMETQGNTGERLYTGKSRAAGRDPNPGPSYCGARHESGKKERKVTI